MRRVVAWTTAAVAGTVIAIPLIRRRTPWGAKTEDERVAAVVAGMLRASYGSRAEDFVIRVRRGRVTLRGDVFALADIEQLETRVRTIQGVRDVENLLRIKPSRPLSLPHGWTALGG